MSDWREVLTHLVHDVEQHYDQLKYRLNDRLGGPDPIKIIPYRGYGSQTRLYLKGRVLEDKGETLATENDRLWDDLLNMYRRLESDEIPYAVVRVRFGEHEQVVTANEEGYFEAWIDLDKPLPADRAWHTVDLELISPRSERQAGAVTARADVLVPSASARFIVISDIDDTVLVADATHMLRMARNVFMGNARTRLPFPGVAAFYRALHAGVANESNPLFFVSSSPWNFYSLLTEFFSLHNIPNPVIFLRDWGITDNELLPLDNREYKIGLIRQMLDFYPGMPFLLVGDSGQQDPEIYEQIAADYPERIQAIYIRNVSRSSQRAEAIRALAEKAIQAKSSLVLADDTLSIARHAVSLGILNPDSLAEIAGEKAKDTAPPSAVDKLLGEEPVKAREGEAPTVKIEPDRQTETVAKETIETALNAGDPDDDKSPTIIVEPENKTEDNKG